MTLKEFEEGYAARSNRTVEEMRSLGYEPRPCDCGDRICQGWKMTTPNARQEEAMAEPEKRETMLTGEEIAQLEHMLEDTEYQWYELARRAVADLKSSAEALRAAEQERDALREALEKYGMHGNTCAAWRNRDGIHMMDERNCDCGLRKALNPRSATKGG